MKNKSALIYEISITEENIDESNAIPSLVDVHQTDYASESLPMFEKWLAHYLFDGNVYRVISMIVNKLIATC